MLNALKRRLKTNVHNQVFVKNEPKSEITEMASKMKNENPNGFYNYGMTLRHTF